MHSKKKNFIISIVIIGIVVVLVFIAGTFYRFQDQHAITKQSLKSTLSSLEEISSIAYDYSRVGRFDDSLGVENWKNQNPKGYFLMTYRGEMKVGVHPDQAKITISDKKITIDMGKIKVLSIISTRIVLKSMMNQPMFLQKQSSRTIQNFSLHRKNKLKMKKESKVLTIRRLVRFASKSQQLYRLMIRLERNII